LKKRSHQKNGSIYRKTRKTRPLLEAQKDTSTKVIAQQKPVEKAASQKDSLSTQLDTSTRPLSHSEELLTDAKKEAKKKPEFDSSRTIVTGEDALERDAQEEQDNTVEIDPAYILEQTFKSKPEVKDSEIEQLIKEKRNRDKYKRSTRVIRTVEKGDTLKSISIGFFGEDASAPIIYHYNQKHVECITYNGKLLAVPIVGRKIVMPEPNEIEAYHKENFAYDHLEFGSALSLEMIAAREKAEKEVQSEVQSENSRSK